MKEKRIVTRDADGKVISIVEHYDLLAKKKQERALLRAVLGIGFTIGFLISAYLFRLGFLKSLLG